MKQITIYDLLPLLNSGWMAMDEDGTWWYYEKKPFIGRAEYWCANKNDYDGKFTNLREYKAIKDVAPFDGDWKDSLIRIDHFHQQGKMVKEEENEKI